MDSVYRELGDRPDNRVTITISRDQIGAPVGPRPFSDSVRFKLTLRLESLRRSPLIAGMFRDSVTGRQILFVRLHRFTDNCANELKSLLVTQLRHEHRIDSVAGVILDLRGNTGGILEEGVAIADALLAKDRPIVSLESRDSAQEREWRSSINPLIQDLPLVVLVDDGTASTAEVVAGAVQDNDRGVIVGENTVGKGLVQSVINLEFGARLRLTTSWYRLPSGRVVQRKEGLGPGLAAIIPESRFESHRTYAGRPVSGGHGIVPDIEPPFDARELLFNRLIDLRIVDGFANALSASGSDWNAPSATTDSMLFDRFVWYALTNLFEGNSRRDALATIDSLNDWYGDATGIDLPEWELLRNAMVDSTRSTMFALRSRLVSEVHQRAEETGWPRNDRALAQYRRDSMVAIAMRLLRDPRGMKSTLNR
jgi:C-terminal peptidase prc